MMRPIAPVYCPRTMSGRGCPPRQPCDELPRTVLTAALPNGDGAEIGGQMTHLSLQFQQTPNSKRRTQWAALVGGGGLAGTIYADHRGQLLRMGDDIIGGAERMLQKRCGLWAGDGKGGQVQVPIVLRVGSVGFPSQGMVTGATVNRDNRSFTGPPDRNSR